jgi:anti-anti-sigma factor
MDFLSTEHKRCTVLKTSGRIDGSNAPDLGIALKEIIKKGVYNIVLDMTDVHFMSSAGWRELINAQKSCKSRGEVVLACVDKGIQESLSWVGMDTLFKIYPDLTSAVGSF